MVVTVGGGTTRLGWKQGDGDRWGKWNNLRSKMGDFGDGCIYGGVDWGLRERKESEMMGSLVGPVGG